MSARIGGVFSLPWQRRHSSADSTLYDPGLKAFHKEEIFIQKHLECTVKFAKYLIPPWKGKMEGVMLLEASRKIKYSGIFVVLSGLPIDPRKQRGLQHKNITEVRFTVEESTIGGRGGAGDYMELEEHAREQYQLEFDIPEDLPLPWITPEGKLIYQMQTFISTVEGRHVKLGEVALRWMGSRVLRKEEIQKQLVVEQVISCRKTFMSMGKKKRCGMEWRVERGGYLPGEGILVELSGQSLDKGGMAVECLVELLQKVWYQVPSRGSNGKMWVNLKVNVLASVGTEEAFQVEGGGGKKVMWMGKLKIPKMITPSQKFELINSVSYTIRASVRVAGELKEHWEKEEVPLIIGTSKERFEGELEETNLEWNDEEILHSFPPTGSTFPLLDASLLHRRGSGGGNALSERSQSMAFFHGRPRSDSDSVMECLVLSPLLIYKLPPSYSQFSL